MEFTEILGAALSVMVDVKFGTLSTVDEEGFPRSRWMSPTTLGRSSGVIYAVTAENLAKVRHIRANPKVEWGFQSANLGSVVRLRGLARLTSNPLLTAEVLEAIGPHLGVFWRIVDNPRQLVVIETTVQSAVLLNSISLERFEAEVHDAHA
ncbi:MAG TPA: pyridoxamine 5'-phosphate oxidase family protein [Rectinemataceae bacterium]|nr:pyridoxamine 5'-phosphate oxidase family protein [Rectinemataceae bacterium]